MNDAPKQIGPYPVEAEIGRGGMGVIFRGRDPKLGRPVAIKVLPEEVAKDPARVDRLRQEATALAALNHPNILTVYDVDTEGEVVYVVTEFLEGSTLRERLDRGGIEWRRASAIAAEIAEGLAAAHARGIVHRDLKPDNIFLTSDGVVKILDFGLAHVAESEGPDGATHTRVTEPGTVLGTVGYMAPEQVRGEAVDARADIFSFGCVLYEMVTGTVPFQRATRADSMSAVLKEPPQPPHESAPGLPPELERVLTRCLEKEAPDRFQSARDLAFSLRGSASESGERAPTSGASAVPVAASRALPRWAQGLAALLVVAAATGWWLARDSGEIAAPASQSIRAIAVLPFANQSGDADMEFLGDGIAESVINSLAALPDLRVIPRNTAFRHRGRDAEIEAVAADLGVQGVVTGRVSRRGDRLVVGVELTDAQNVSQLWGDRYDTSIDEILSVESSIARRITDALEITLSGEQADQIGKRYTEVSAAHLAYMEARHAWGTRSAEGFRRALVLYDRAIAADPSFALAHASKAETYAMMMLYLGSSSSYAPQLRQEVATALRLDPDLAEAYPAQGFIELMEKNWAGADAAFRTAIELNPTYATAHHWYSVYFLSIGDPEGRLQKVEDARRLDPGSLVIATDVAYALVPLGRTEEARVIFEEVREAAPTFWRALEGLGNADLDVGRYADAALRFEQAVEMAGEIAWTDGLVAMAHGKAGDLDRARQELQRMEQRAATGYVSPFGFARAYLGLDDLDRCFEWLERAAADRDPMFMIGWGRFLPEVVADPRWLALEKRMNFPG